MAGGYRKISSYTWVLSGTGHFFLSFQTYSQCPAQEFWDHKDFKYCLWFPCKPTYNWGEKSWIDLIGLNSIPLHSPKQFYFISYSVFIDIKATGNSSTKCIKLVNTPWRRGKSQKNGYCSLLFYSTLFFFFFSFCHTLKDRRFFSTLILSLGYSCLCLTANCAIVLRTRIQKDV